MSNYRHGDTRAFKGIVAAVALSIPIWLLGISAYQALNLPIVAKDIDGRVVYVEFSDGTKHYGAKELPKKYQSITVAMESMK